MSAMFPTLILAGGLATRLRPLTEKIPKALIDINGEPFITHQLRLLRQHGICNVVMCVGYLGEMLQDFLGDGNHLGMNIQYAFDGEKLLGTAGAIKNALPLVDENFFVLYGDSYLPCNYAAVQQTFSRQNKLGLMTVFHNQDQWDISNVIYQQESIIKYDKNKQTPDMHHIDYGLGIFNKKAFNEIPANTHYDLALLYQDLLKKNHLGGYEIPERFYEVGSLNGIEELRGYLAQNI